MTSRPDIDLYDEWRAYRRADLWAELRGVLIWLALIGLPWTAVVLVWRAI